MNRDVVLKKHIFTVSCNLRFDIIGWEDFAKAAPCWGNPLLRNQFESLRFDYLVILDFLPVGVKRSISLASLPGRPPQNGKKYKYKN